MLKHKRLIGIIATLAICLSFLAPLAFAPVALAANYSALSVQSVSPGLWYNAGATNWNRLIMEIPEGSLTVGDATTTTFRVSLPSNYAFTFNDAGVPAAAVKDTAYPLTMANAFPALVSSGTGNIIGAVTVTPKSDAVANAGINSFREWDVTVTPVTAAQLAAATAPAAPAVAGKGLLYLNLKNVYIASGTSSDVVMTIDGPPGSPFSSGTVILGKSGSGTSDITISSVDTVTSAGGQTIGDIKIKEDRPGALQNGADSIKIKLPNGFTWGTLVAATNTPTLIWGSAGTVPAFANLDPTIDSRRTLAITIPAASIDATYFTIPKLPITVDETIAKAGDIEVVITGRSGVNQSTLIVGKYGDLGAKFSGISDKEVIAGRAGQEIGKFAIEELVKGSLVNNRTITLQLTGGAKWNGASAGALTDPPVIDASASNLYGITPPVWALSGTNGDTIKTTIATPAAGSSDAAKMVFKLAEINVSPAAESEIKLVVGGTEGVVGDPITIAKVVKPVKVTSESVANIVAGAQGQKLPDIVVEELLKEAITSTNAAGAFAPFNPGVGGPAGGLYLEFPTGVFPSLPTVSVVEGDVTIDNSSVARGVTADGRWVVGVTVKSTGSKLSKIKFSGLTLRVDRDVPEGPIYVAVKGNVVQTGLDFPGQTTVAAGAVANVVTPASAEVGKSASFYIGSTIMNMSGSNIIMDAAPYIKAGRTYVPVRYLGDALGATTAWDAATQTVTVTKGDKNVVLVIGSKTAKVNGADVAMDVAPEITGGRTMLPARYVAEGLGYAVGWNAALQQIVIQ